MALWVCEGCSTKYAVGLSRCPRCHSSEFYEEGAMPKITRHGGPSDATANPPTADDPGVEMEAAGTGRAMEGVGAPADGTTKVEIVGDGSGEALPPIEATADDTAPDDDTEVDVDVEPDTEASADDDAAIDAAARQRPNINASKADWLAYAQACAPDEDLAGFTKAELIELYGDQA